MHNNKNLAGPHETFDWAACNPLVGHSWFRVSDNVTRVDNPTRVTIFGDSDSTRVTLTTMVTRLESSHVLSRMTRVESQSVTRDSSQSNFYKVSESLMDKPSLFERNEVSFCPSVMIKIGAYFLFWLSSPGVPNRGYEIEHQGVRRSLGHRAAYISLIEQYISQIFWGGTKNALTWQRGTSSKKGWEPLVKSFYATF